MDLKTYEDIERMEQGGDDEGEGEYKDCFKNIN